MPGASVANARERGRRERGAPAADRAQSPCLLFSASIFFSSSAFSASRLKVAPFCMGGELEEGLSVLTVLLLHEDEAQELVGEPVVERDQPAQAGVLERIEPEVDDDLPAYLYR